MKKEEKQPTPITEEAVIKLGGVNEGSAIRLGKLMCFLERGAWYYGTSIVTSMEDIEAIYKREGGTK